MPNLATTVTGDLNPIAQIKIHVVLALLHVHFPYFGRIKLGHFPPKIFS